MAIANRVRELVAPVIEATSAQLYDVEHHGSTVRVLVDSEGGIDLAELAQLSRKMSRVLDDHEVISGRYMLEVSSPGLERPLRTTEHYRSAEGSEVQIKTRAEFDGPRRMTGLLESVQDAEVRLRFEDGSSQRVGLDEIVSARTVFDWNSGRAAGRPQAKQKSGGET